MITLILQGGKTAVQRLKGDGTKILSAYAGAVYLWAADTLTKTMRLAPVATGFMRSGRFLTRPTVDSDGSFEMEMGYGATYAKYVEEREARHQVGQAHFFRDGMEQGKANARAAISRRARELFEADIGVDGVSSAHPITPLIGPEPTVLLAKRRASQSRRRKNKASRREANGFAGPRAPWER